MQCNILQVVSIALLIPQIYFVAKTDPIPTARYFTQKKVHLGMGKLKVPKNGNRKDLIVKAGAALFREKGFGAASMRDLAENLGIEAASLYNHIRSKNEILESVCFNVANRFNLHLDEIESGNLSPIKKIETLLRFHIQQMIDNYEEVIVSDREWKHLDEPYRSNFHTQRRNYRKRFAAIIEDGMKKGEIKKIDAPTAVVIMLHSVSGIESWHRSTAKISAAELEDNMVLIMIDGLRK
jgi:TetR/AcrR family transcriptional regulator, cholesterol catabolism regulator